MNRSRCPFYCSAKISAHSHLLRAFDLVSTTLTAGARLGPYEIVALLGSGGMGEVYRARDTKLGRDVAIKVLPGMHAVERERRTRFEREAQLLAALNHPHIAAIYGFEDSSVPALVMELVEGPTLADAIAGRPLPLQEAIRIARQLALALDAAHDRGIVHRDLKPANIKIAANGTIKVLDFGLAKAIASDSAEAAMAATTTDAATADGVILGTAPYMSPEQARGQVVDKRTDIWAFGCVLFEMLTGRRAFAGATMPDVLTAILSREPDLSDLPSDVPSSLHQLLRRCLEKDPQKRLRDIGDAFTDVPEPERRARIAVAPVVAGIAIAALLLMSIATMLWSRPADADDGLTPDRLVATRLTDYGGAASAPAISPDGRAFVFVSDHGGTPDIWLRQIAGGEPVRLTNDEAPESDLIYAADGESLYFTRTDADGVGIWQTGILGGRPRRIVAGARAPAPAPDGRRLAFLQRDGSNTWSLVIRTLDNAESRAVVKSLPGSVTRAAWSKDGRRLAYSRGGLFAPSNLFVLDVATGQDRQVTGFTRGNEGTYAQAWLPDNEHLIVSYVPFPRQLAAADIGILDVNGGSITRVTTTVQQALNTPSVSADGTRMLAASVEPEREVWRVPRASREAPTRLLGPRGDPMWISITGDGRQLLFNETGSGSRNLSIAPLARPADARQITFVPGDAIAHSSASPDGSRVAFVSTSTGNSDVWVQNVDGTDLRQLTNDPAADAWPVWSPDGRWVVYTSLRQGRQETWRSPAGGGTAEKLFDGFFRGDWRTQPGGSGTWIVTSDGVDRVRLLDVERRAVLWEIRVPGSALALPMFSPDGSSFSLPFQAGHNQDTIGIFDTSTGARRMTVELPFRVFFRACWVDDGSAFVVNRAASPSQIVLFDRFWADPSRNATR
jgi:Tol biopolymer transport system component